MRLIAVDWSGAVHGAGRRIWLAEATPPDHLVRLEAGRDRDALADELLATIAGHARVVIGLDFAFSFPRWHLQALGLQSAPALWAHLAQHGERWLADCAPPLWGRRGRSRPTLGEHFRRTEHALLRRGARPKSVFQIGGAGAVGTGSIRGMPLLHRLRAAGASVWPFDPPGWPLVVEIYPRLLTGAVVKSRSTERKAYLDRYYPHLATWPIDSEDAFDAAVSAMVMAHHAHDLRHLPAESEPALRLEGRIWHPEWRTDVT